MYTGSWFWEDNTIFEKSLILGFYKNFEILIGYIDWWVIFLYLICENNTLVLCFKIRYLYKQLSQAMNNNIILLSLMCYSYEDFYVKESKRFQENNKWQ